MTDIRYTELPSYLARTDSEAERAVIAFAGTRFEKPYYFARGDAIRGLGLIGQRPHLRAEVVGLLVTGLRTALMRGSEGPEACIDANSIGVAAAAIALARLGAVESLPAVAAAFSTVTMEERHFELRQCAGPLAIALAVMGGTAKEEVAAVLARDDRTWGARQEFVNQLRYAVWMLTADLTGPLQWLTSDTQGAHYAAAALADLDAVSAKPALEALLPTLKSKGARRAVVCALRRIGAGPRAERMIFSCPLWHSNEPADEFRGLYTSVLDDKALDV